VGVDQIQNVWKVEYATQAPECAYVRTEPLAIRLAKSKKEMNATVNHPYTTVIKSAANAFANTAEV